MSELVFLHCPLQKKDIPDGWQLVSVGQIVEDIQTGFASGKHNRDGIGVPHLRPMNISPGGQIDLTDSRYVNGENPLRLRRGDVLFNNTNSPVWVGKTALIERDDELAFSNHMTRLRMPSGIAPAFVAKQLHFLCSSGYFMYQCKKHVNQASINRTFLGESTPFLLPPSNEQHRIVAKIEALQERSRKAREALAEVGPLLEQFRQSLLAAAFRGDLTADWRAENPDVEPASELFARIRTERRQKWEQAELAKYEAKGKTPPKNWQDKYKEPEPVDEADLPELPEGWCWVRAEEVCEYITKGTTPPKGRMMEDEGEIRFLKVGNLTFDGTLDFSKENAYIDEETHSSGVWARSRIYPGDVLMNLVGPPLGKVALVPPEVPQSNVNQAIAIFRPIAGLSSVFLTHSLLTPSILERIIRRAKATAGQRNLTLELSRGLPVSLPPSREQAEISNRLKAALESISTLEITCEEAEANLDQLDQSILAKAFRGELVPQDPQDEPAAVLLERIRQQREAAAQNGKPKQKTVKRRGKTKSNGIPRRGPLG